MMPSSGWNARPAKGDMLCSLLYLWWMKCSSLQVIIHSMSFSCVILILVHDRKAATRDPVGHKWRFHQQPEARLRQGCACRRQGNHL